MASDHRPPTFGNRVGARAGDRVGDRVGDRIAEGRAAFNRGEFFAAHEIWEEAWRGLDGAERGAVQGLIQIAAGLHHLQRGRPRPAARLLGKGLEKLQTAPAAVAGLPVEPLARDVARLVAALEAPGPRRPDPTAIKL